MQNIRRLCALGLSVIVAAVPAAAQFGLRTGALGGSLGSRTMSRPLGGFASGYASSGTGRYRYGASRTPLYGYPYTYSVWVPDYYDYLNTQSQYAPPYPAPVPQDAAAPQQPVIINQYFSAPGPPPVDAPVANTNDPQAALNGTPGDPIGTPQNYYLIAYKNHNVYTALAYWVEDKTLHYVTTQNTHNQASLDLIDLTLTKSLNRHNDVPFTIPGQ